MGGEVWVGLEDFIREDGAEGVVGREGVRQDAYAREVFAGHLVEEDELWEGVGWVGVEVDVFGVAYIEDGGLRACDAPGKD